ncbi:ParA family protein [Caballeronia grimmiae]|uniref:ParA family protein n=1 Tax=Caballeronia grimmiae TaxID=1071679 RepID=UPI001FD25369|nr:ParA family protein [Caballeronia grimmiae]
MTVTELEVDAYTDFASLSFPPQFAADALRISPQTLKIIERDNQLKISRVSRGSVEVRSYSLADIFQIARIRRDNKSTKAFSRPITVANFVPKGGTGKTTTTCDFAIQFAYMGLKVLVIDNDQQADASTMLGYDPDLTAEELIELGVPADRGISGHIGNLMRIGNFYQPMTLDEVIKKPFGELGPHLIPAEDSLDDMDAALRSANGSDFRYSLFFEQARAGEIPHCDLSGYDVIIIDNAPAGSLLSRNSMVAADFLICPIRMDKFSYRALSRLAYKLNEFAKDFKRAPEIVAIPTMYVKNRPRIERNLSQLVALFPGKVTESRLFYSEDYSKSLDEGIPLSMWRPGTDNSLGAMRDVFDEFVARIRAFTEGTK